MDTFIGNLVVLCGLSTIQFFWGTQFCPIPNIIYQIYSRNVGLNQKKYWQHVYQRKKIRITQIIQQECQPQTGIDQKSDIQSKLLPF
jgi:hypothetical protein